MTTDVLAIDAVSPQRDRLEQAAECLRRGGLVAFPTETVYGLGAHALDRDAVRRIFTAKQRPATDPLIVHVTSLDAAAPLLRDVPPMASELARRFWPGPLTLVLPRTAIVPDDVTAGLDTVGIRVPAHAVARALLEVSRLPIAAPSANLFSRPSPTTAAHVLQDLGGRIDLVLDAGATIVGVESTVLDLSGPVPTVLRPGAVTLDMLRPIVPTVALREATAAREDAPLPSPGLLEKHYSPRTPLVVFRGEPEVARLRTADEARRLAREGASVVLLGTREDVAALTAALREDAPGEFIDIGARGDVGSVAHRLYAAFREADAKRAQYLLLCDTLPPGGLTDAIRDRMNRAAVRVEHA